MQVTKRTHLHASLQNTIFMVLLITIIGLIAWLSTHYKMQADWTINNRHTLSQASQKVLAELTQPIKITAYVGKNSEVRVAITELIARYQRQADNINLHFVDPVYAPDEVRQQGIQGEGEILIHYQDRTEHLRFLSEQDLTSALQRLMRPARLAVFLEGHGERLPTHFENHDLSEWADALKKGGVQIQNLNFGKNAMILDNADVLVIASPRNELLPGEVTLIANYLDKGGHLLWLMDPTTPLQGLEPIAEKLGLTILPGMIVDPISRLLGVDNPAVVSITTDGYGDHPVTSTSGEFITLFPHASGLIVEPPEDEGWEATALLTTNPQAWSETGEVEGTIEFNEESDINGPLDIAFAMVRDKAQIDDSEMDDEGDEGEKEVEELEKEVHAEEDVHDTEEDIHDEHIHDDIYEEQRVIIVGEGDFLSNAFVGYGGNLELALNMMNWLAADDTLIDIPSKTAIDLDLELSANVVILLGGFFLLILPLGLITTGISIWLKRRKA